MPADTTIAQLSDPAVPLFEPLPEASVKEPLTQIVTTASVNGANGSVDAGGQIDQIAAATEAHSADGLAAWSQSTFGMPWYAPSVFGSMRSGTALVLGAFMGGFHGYRRSGGKPLPTTGYAIAGAIAPLLTLGVGLVQGFAKPRRR